jgi:uncharacterized protein (DUF1697 family)
MDPHSSPRQRPVGQPPQDSLEDNGSSVPERLPSTEMASSVEVERITRELWTSVQHKRWRRVSRQLEDTKDETTFSPADRAQILSSKSSDGQSLLHALLHNSAPTNLLKRFILAGTPFTRTSSFDAPNGLLVADGLEVSFALDKGRFEQAHALINAGAPVLYADDQQNSSLHQVESTLSKANLSYVDFLSLGLCQSILAEAPVLLSHRNQANELPITCFAESCQWSAVELLAKEHSREEEISLSLEESYALYMWALANDAPLSTLRALEPIADYCHETDTLDGIPQMMQAVLYLPLLPGATPTEFDRVPIAPSWSKFTPLLRFMEKSVEEFPKQLLTALLNFRFPDERLRSEGIHKRNPLDPPLLYWVTRLEAESNIVLRLIDLGADPGQPFDYYHAQSSRFFERCTLMHVVVFEENIGIWNALPRKGDLLARPNDEGELPIHMYLAESSKLVGDSLKIAVEWTKRVLRESDSRDPKTKNESHSNIADILLTEGSFALFTNLGSSIVPPSIIDPEAEYQLLDDDSIVSADWLLKVALDHLRFADRNIREEAADLLSYSNSLYDFYLYSEAYRNFNDNGNSGAALVKLMPSVLWKYPTGSLRELMGEIEAFHDTLMGSGHRPISHHNEAEMLLLLNHPRLPSLAPEHTNYITSVFTSVPRFIDEDPQIPLKNFQTIENWQRIGALTHNHLRYKHDARPARVEDDSTLPALLEEFGLRAIAGRHTDFGDPRENIPPLGKGYLLQGMAFDGLERTHRSGLDEEETTFSSATTIELRQGYFLTVHPDAGTLIVRNSSLVFGRDALYHPAYWSPVGVGEEISLNELLNLSVDEIQLGLMHIGHLDIHRENVAVENNKNIAFLLDQFKIFQAEYRNWKFNSDDETAFVEVNGRRRLSDTGAWNAPGFKEIVTRLNCWLGGSPNSAPDASMIAEKPPLALAFAHPHLPPWSTHSFIDEHGHKQQRLSLNEERMGVLNDLVRGRASRHELIDSGLQSFFQVAGINTHGELIIVDDTQAFGGGRDE